MEETRDINRIDSIPMSDINAKIIRVISGQKIGNRLMSCHALWCPITKKTVKVVSTYFNILEPEVAGILSKKFHPHIDNILASKAHQRSKFRTYKQWT